MTETMIEADPRGFRAPGTTFMISGGLVGAVGAYLFQVIGANAIGSEDFAPISLLWTAFFILATISLVPIEQYVTREVASGRKAIPNAARATYWFAVAAAVVSGMFVIVTRESLFVGSWQYVVQAILLVVGYSLLFFGKGVLAGRRRFADVGWVLIIETVVRLLAGIVAIQLFASAESLGWAMVLGGFSVLGMRWWRRDSGDEDASPAPATRFLGGYIGGSTSSQLLLGGAPIAAALFGASPSLVSVIFVTFTLYRAPLTLIFALQGRVLPYLVGLTGGTDRRRLARIAGMVVAAGVGLALLGALVGWLVGPEVVGLLYNEEFIPERAVAALAAGGVMAAAAAQIAGQVLVAEGRTSRLAVAWLVGLVVALVVMVFYRPEPDLRVATGFAVGESVSLFFMWFLAARK
jgi:O-antigen/teichoic acid export membrane protein